MKVFGLKLTISLEKLGYLFALLVAVTFSVPALAQEHGVGVGKGCPNATKVGDLATCGLAVANQDEFGDDLRILQFWDVIDPDGLALRHPASGNLPIVQVSEGVICDQVPEPFPDSAPIGLVFPCVIPGSAEPGGSGLGILVRSEYTVPVGSTDPLIDQGFVITQDECNVQPIGCSPEEQQQQFGAAVSLFVPSIDVTKTGTDVAKVGDEITYTLGFTDTTTGTGFPGFENCTGNDPLLGGDLGTFTAGVTRDFLYTVQVGDPDPLLNTATITCGVVGFDNVVANTDSHSVDLIGPTIEVTKTGPAEAKVGDEITYTIGFIDTTADGSLGICTGNDPLLGGDLGVFVDGVTRDFPYTIQVGDADPLVNTVTITCGVIGFDNEVSGSDSHIMNLIAPSVSLTKACSPNPVFVGGTIEWSISVNNNGDTDLLCLLNDPIVGFVDEPVAVLAGGTEMLGGSQVVDLDDIPGISNIATISCAIAGYDNEITDIATAECDVLDNNIGVPTLSDGARWLLILMILGAGLLLLNRYSPRLRE